MEQRIKKVLMIGCGAIGSNLLHNLVHDLKDVTFFALDRDKIEARNIQAGTQFFTRQQIGMEKTKALQLNIYQASGIRINPVTMNLQRKDQLDEVISQICKVGSFGSSELLVIDSLDNATARNMVSTFCGESLDCVHVSFSPQFTFDIAWNKGQAVVFDDTNHKIDICEMPGARSFVQYVAGLSGQVVGEFVRTGQQHNLFGNRYTVRKS